MKTQRHVSSGTYPKLSSQLNPQLWTVSQSLISAQLSALGLQGGCGKEQRRGGANGGSGEWARREVGRVCPQHIRPTALPQASGSTASPGPPGEATPHQPPTQRPPPAPPPCNARWPPALDLTAYVSRQRRQETARRIATPHPFTYSSTLRRHTSAGGQPPGTPASCPG